MEEIPTAERVLDTRENVKGIIYCVSHTESGKQYIGQTVTHRLNKGKYRPYGARRRFAEHCSNAKCNTKKCQSTCLNNAIREFGRDAFTYSVLEECELDQLNSRESYWIAVCKSLYPQGYNQTTGGTVASEVVVTLEKPPLNTPGIRGGSSFRSNETRIRMSTSVRVTMATTASRTKRSLVISESHLRRKRKQFESATVDKTDIDQYLSIRKKHVFVKVGDCETRFYGKTVEEQIAHAKEFLMSLKSKET